jgi:DNA-binding GntR family transcriptional regulator
MFMNQAQDDGRFDPVRLATLHSLPRADFVYSALKEALTSGRFHPGDRIREEEIACALGVSRTPVREGLSRLLARGLIQEMPGRGLVVTVLDKQQVLEMSVIRKALEPIAARLAAQHAATAEIEQLRMLVKQFAAATEDTEWTRINRLIHQTIHEASRNRYLIQWLNEFRDAMSLLPYPNYSSSNRFRPACKEHSLIVEAIAARDAKAAEEAARIHVRNGEAHRLKMLLET